VTMLGATTAKTRGATEDYTESSSRAAAEATHAYCGMNSRYDQGRDVEKFSS
jgi:hypothetical protein